MPSLLSQLFILTCIGISAFVVAQVPVIFRPGTASSPPYVSLWSEVQEIVEDNEGAVIVYFDDSVVAPVIVPASTLDGHGRVIFTSASQRAEFDNLSHVTRVLLMDGVVFQNIRRVGMVLQFEASPQTVVPFQFSSGKAVLFESARFLLASDATLPFIQVADGEELIVAAYLGTFFQTLAEPIPVIDLLGSAKLELFLEGPILASSGIIRGGPGSTLFYPHDAAVGTLTLPAFEGTLSEGLLDQAEGVAYADHYVYPPLIPSPPPKGPTVQLALDAVKSYRPFFVTITDTVVGENMVTWSTPFADTQYWAGFTQVAGTSTTILLTSKSTSSLTFTDSVGGNSFEVYLSKTLDNFAVSQ